MLSMVRPAEDRGPVECRLSRLRTLPMPSLASLALFIHIAGVAVWVGGMTFALSALRPAAAETLEPPQRLALMSAALAHFFSLLTAAIIAVVASGFFLIASLGGFGHVGPDIHAMAGAGLAMTAIYAYVRVVPFPQLRAAVAVNKWPDGAAALARIRMAVTLNLVLGVLTIAVATLPR